LSRHIAFSRLSIGLQAKTRNADTAHQLRIRIAQIVMDYLAHGWSADEMCRQHPYLLIAEAHAAMAYYFDHQEQVDAEIRDEFQTAQAARKAQPDSPFVTKLRAWGII